MLQKRFLDTPQLNTVTFPEGELTDHIIIIGAGRVGQYIARVLVATAPSSIVTRAVASHAQRHNPGMHIVVARAEGPDQLSELHEAGIYEVGQPEFEAGLEITRQALPHVGFSARDIQQVTDNAAADTKLEACDMVAVLGDLPQYGNFLALAGISGQPRAETLSF